MIPDFVPYVTWFVAGIFATGAFWYFLSQRNYHMSLWAAFLAVVLALLAVAFHIHNDLVRRDKEGVRAFSILVVNPSVGRAYYCSINNESLTNSADVTLDIFSEGSLVLANQILGTIPPMTSKLLSFVGNSVSLTDGTSVSLTGLGANNRYTARLTVRQYPMNVTISCSQIDHTGAKRIPVHQSSL
jgi:hypothetical protein